MSMNLCFKFKKHHIDFPFQTPTVLSYDVMKETTREKRFEVVKKYIHEIYTEDSTYANHIINECKDMMLDPDLTLIII